MKKIRLTENELKHVITESVKRTLNEFFSFNDSDEDDNNYNIDDEDTYYDMVNSVNGMREYDAECAQDYHPQRDSRMASDVYRCYDKDMIKGCTDMARYKYGF